jgi:type II secretory pathway pseudopilin PulG
VNFNKKSFTLIEIVVVLLIMGFIYTIGISSFSKKTLQEDSYHFDLKSFLQDSLTTYDKKIELIVLDDFAVVRVNDDKKTDIRFTLPKNILFYSYWSNGKQKEYFQPYYLDDVFKDVTFRYIVYKNQKSTKCIVEKDEKFHIQTNYFKDDSVFEELNDAIEYLLLTEVKNSSVLADE